MQQDEIILRKGIVHILDGELGYPVYSEQQLDITPDLNEFFTGHIFKIMSGDDMRNAILMRKVLIFTSCLKIFRRTIL